MALTKEIKEQIIKKYAKPENNVGSPEVQIALLTKEIEILTEHAKKFPQDNSSKRGLISKVNQRRSLSQYLMRTNPQGYEQLIASLGLRK